MRTGFLLLGSALSLGSVSALGCGGSDEPLFPAGTSTSSAATGAGGAGASGSGGGATTSTGSGGGQGGMGTGGDGGTGGSAPVCMPEGPFDGDPIDANPGEWTWVAEPMSQCRNGSATGFGVRLNPASDKLMIYLEGGAACFNFASCLINPESYSQFNFNTWRNSGGQSGIFNPDNANNPVREWNAVYIPYCTGDVHAGDATGVDVPGIASPKNQSFVGYRNIGLFLKRIIPTFPNVTEVLLTGVSAGGFGAAYNYDRIAQAFCPRPVILIDDSGPPMADMYLAPCLQTRWRELWNLNATLPADCTDCALPNGGGIVNYTTYIAKKYPASRMGLISSDQDETIAGFFGYGQENCDNLDGIAGAMPPDEFAEGLLHLRNNYLSMSPAWATYFVSSTSHTYLGGGAYYNTTVNNVPLIEWVDALVNGGQAGHVGP